MNKGLWIARKNCLLGMIRQVSEFHGGDDAQWLREHVAQVLDISQDDRIEESISCYKELIEQFKYNKRRGK